MANPMKRECLFIIEKGLVAHRGFILEMGTLIGVERIYNHNRSTASMPSPPAITLCHCVALCLERDALLHVVSEFPKVQYTMRKVVVRIIFREAIISCRVSSNQSHSSLFTFPSIRFAPAGLTGVTCAYLRCVWTCSTPSVISS